MKERGMTLIGDFVQPLLSPVSTHVSAGSLNTTVRFLFLPFALSFSRTTVLGIAAVAADKQRRGQPSFSDDESFASQESERALDSPPLPAFVSRGFNSDGGAPSSTAGSGVDSAAGSTATVDASHGDANSRSHFAEEEAAPSAHQQEEEEEEESDQEAPAVDGGMAAAAMPTETSDGEGRGGKDDGDTQDTPAPDPHASPPRARREPEGAPSAASSSAGFNTPGSHSSRSSRRVVSGAGGWRQQAKIRRAMVLAVEKKAHEDGEIRAGGSALQARVAAATPTRRIANNGGYADPTDFTPGKKPRLSGGVSDVTGNSHHIRYPSSGSEYCGSIADGSFTSEEANGPRGHVRRHSSRSASTDGEESSRYSSVGGPGTAPLHHVLDVSASKFRPENQHRQHHRQQDHRFLRRGDSAGFSKSFGGAVQAAPATVPAPTPAFPSAPRYSGSLRSKLEQKQRQAQEDEQLVAPDEPEEAPTRSADISWDDTDSITDAGSGVTDFALYDDDGPADVDGAGARGGPGPALMRATSCDGDGGSVTSTMHSVSHSKKGDPAFKGGGRSPPQCRGEPSGEMAASSALLRQSQSDQLVLKLKLQLEQHHVQHQPDHDDDQAREEERRRADRRSSTGSSTGTSSSRRRRRRHHSCSSTGGSSVEGEGGKAASVAGSDHHQHQRRRRDRGSGRGSRSVDGGSSR